MSGEKGTEGRDEQTRRLIAADVDAIGRIAAVESILEVICRSTGVRFAAVARVTQATWVACAVRDEIAFGLKPGGELPIRTTLCDEVRASESAVIIDQVSRDPQFRDHRTPRIYGFESYISMPIMRANGDFFGTLCALDPLPAKLSDPKIVKTFELFSQLIGLQLDAEERLQQSQKDLMDEQQTAELREQFIAVLGHDLRNPLFSITAGTEVLARLPMDPRAVGIVERIRRSGDRMAKLVDNILDFARGRLGGGLPILKQADSELEQAITHVVAELSAVHPDRQIELQLEIGEGVSCDPGRIAQLLSNLLSNALTHGAADRPVRVQATVEGGEFQLSVTNEGDPIPGKIIERLFQPFSRLAADKRQEGLGLGLYIASQIAVAHGGALTVESLPAATTFRLTMPVAGS